MLMTKELLLWKGNQDLLPVLFIVQMSSQHIFVYVCMYFDVRITWNEGIKLKATSMMMKKLYLLVEVGTILFAAYIIPLRQSSNLFFCSTFPFDFQDVKHVWTICLLYMEGESTLTLLMISSLFCLLYMLALVFPISWWKYMQLQTYLHSTV